MTRTCQCDGWLGRTLTLPKTIGYHNPCSKLRGDHFPGEWTGKQRLKVEPGAYRVLATMCPMGWAGPLWLRLDSGAWVLDPMGKV